MIYSIKKEDFPKKELCYEINTYLDDNDFEWKIATVRNGFFIGYFGDDYFKDKEFVIEIKDKNYFLKNTGCFFISNCDFDIFYEFREIIKNGNTYEIFDCIKTFLKERLKKDKTLMEAEV